MAKSNVKFGPKHAVATRPWGTVHLSARHGVGTPVFQTLKLNIYLFDCVYNYFLYINVITYYLKTFLHEAENNRKPQGDQHVKHMPPPPTRFRGTPSS